ncbi:hypothetical protein [Amphibacillus jilinensis]|uniref:hypothetical protein n=1 Tax=Amphibacillus jilinensis TaxID=1216008 RepID=UPI0002D80902|nr:hypothetical protein [Amphibacillus jilinensis]
MSIKVTLIIILCFILIGIAFFYKDDVKEHFLKDTLLLNSSLGTLEIDQKIISNDIKKLETDFGAQQKVNNVIVLESIKYQKELNFNKLHIKLQEEGVVAIVSENEKTFTDRGIKVGDSLTKVKELYGENYINKTGELGNILLYKDKENNIKIEFLYYNDQVVQIMLIKLD